MRQHRHSKGNNDRHGFTLIEVSMVIVIMGFVFAAGMIMAKSYFMSTRTKVTREHMTAINQAITQFIRLNGRLPCVADLSAPVDTAAFSVEKNCSTLTTSANHDYVRNSDRGLPSPDVAIGAVPTRSLNISDEDVVDGWGNRFTYVVTMSLASPPVPPATFPIDLSQGGITIKDGNGNDYVSPPGSATYLLISHGADGLGAFEGYPAASGTAPPKACPAAPAAESANCAFEGDAATTVEAFKTTLETGINFDDYVSVGTVNSGTMSADVKIVQGLSTTPNYSPAFVQGGNLPAGTGIPPYYADCPQGYKAVACSGAGSGGASCQGIPMLHTLPPQGSAPTGITVGSCKYGDPSTVTCGTGATYNFFTTCVRY